MGYVYPSQSKTKNKTECGIKWERNRKRVIPVWEIFDLLAGYSTRLFKIIETKRYSKLGQSALYFGLGNVRLACVIEYFTIIANNINQKTYHKHYHQWMTMKLTIENTLK